jgi:septum formation protein
MFRLTHKLILGSKSPRRQELLKGMGFEFEIRTQDSDESFPEEMELDKVAEFIAEQKAKVLIPTLKNDELLICSDTAVIVDNQFLAKPENRDYAVAMLKKLSGKTHKVVTGVYLAIQQQAWSFSNTTLVTFSELSDQEINHYVDTYKPYDKAGSYGIQEWIGFIGIEKMEGSYFNVMGLPTAKLWKELSQLGFVKFD